jgi:hypothetical protein
MSKLTIFEKGSFQPVSNEFKIEGITALQSLSGFQEKFQIFDTDTTINSIRDTIIASYLGYDLVNTEKHGFDAKKSKTGEFLEIKQCSIIAGRWGGTWNDTSEDKAKAFYDERVWTAIGIWKGAANLEFIIYGQNPKLGEYLLEKVINRKVGSRSTQSIEIAKFIKQWGFSVVVPAEKRPEEVIQQIISYQKSLSEYVNINTVKQLSDI